MPSYGMIRMIMLGGWWLVLPGCAAIGVREAGTVSGPFAGVRNDAFYLVHPTAADMPAWQAFNLLDLPFSLIIDMACLPGDLSAAQNPPN